VGFLKFPLKCAWSYEPRQKKKKKKNLAIVSVVFWRSASPWPGHGRAEIRDEEKKRKTRALTQAPRSPAYFDFAPGQRFTATQRERTMSPLSDTSLYPGIQVKPGGETSPEKRRVQSHYAHTHTPFRGTKSI